MLRIRDNQDNRKIYENECLKTAVADFKSQFKKRSNSNLVISYGVYCEKAGSWAYSNEKAGVQGKLSIIEFLINKGDLK